MAKAKKEKSDDSSRASLLAPTSAASIVAARVDYEQWLREQVHVVEADLRPKHRDMAGSLFAFLRATFYRWGQLWKEVCDCSSVLCGSRTRTTPLRTDGWCAA